MFKAGKLVLLLILFFGIVGATQQLHAQEKTLAQTFAFQSKKPACNSLNGYLVTNPTKCEEVILTQKENVVKAEAKNTQNKPAVFSYATEPTFYNPPFQKSSATPTPTIRGAVVAQNQASQSQNNISVNSDTIFNLINAHRAQIGKPAFQKDESLCQLARTRSIEIEGELFGGKGYLHSGLYNRNLPYWVTENAKWGSNESRTVQWWLNSPIHRAAIDSAHTYSCGACNGSFCSQLFTSYIPKA